MFSVPRLSRRVLRWIVIAVLLLATYAAAGFWLVPKLVASTLRDTVAERYQRAAKLGKVTFNPFSIELEAHDFALPDADGGPLLSFERLYVNLAWISVFRGGPAFQAIALDAPLARVVRRKDGSLNLADFASPSDDKPEPDAPPPRLWIDDLAIRNGRATLLDQDRPQPLALDFGPITFQVRNFSTRSEGNEYSLTVQATHGEKLTWRGDFGLAPFASHGKFSLQNIQAQTLAEVAAESVPFQVTRGAIAAEGSYSVAGRGKDLKLRVDVSQLLVEMLGLRVKGEASDAVALARLIVSNLQLDMPDQTIKVEHVLLDELQVAAARDASGQIDLQRMLPRAQSQEQPSVDEKPWTVSVPDIALRAADLKLDDQRASQVAHFRLAPLDLTVSGFTIPSAGPLQLILKSGVNESGRIATHGQLDVAALSGRFDIEATAVPLPPVQPYLDEVAGFNLISGNANAKGTLTVSAGRTVSFEGQAGIDDLKTTDKELAEDFVKWASLRLTGLKVQSEPLSVAIAEVAVKEPYARVVISETGTTNIQDVLSPRGAHADGSTDSLPPAAAPQPQAAAALPVEIDLIRVDAGSVNFADRSIKPHFDTGIQTLSGTIKGLSARPNARADVQLAGQVDRYTPVKITGKVNYFAAVTYTDLHILFRNLELTSLSPYSGKFAGYRIDRGKLKVDLNYLIKKRKLSAKHKVVIDQLQLGKQVDSPDATSLPVKLAIALLKDRNGVIDLDIPVSGDLDDPQFRVWPIVWQVVLNLLTKIVTSPFALLGSLFGGGEDISFVDLAPASPALSAATKAKLQALTKALVERPALNLDVPLVIKPDVDGPALHALHWQAERERLARRKLGWRGKDAAAVTQLLSTPREYRALLEGAYREALGRAPEFATPTATALPPSAAAKSNAQAKSPPHTAAASPAVPDAVAIQWLEQQLKARITIAQSDFEDLARDRAQQVQAVVLDNTGIDPARVFVITSEPLAADAPLRMQLSLH